MSYVSKVLQPEERVLMLGRLHWITYREAAIALVLALLVFWFGGKSFLLHVIGWSLLAASVGLAIFAAFNQWITEIAVTTKRVIYKHGFIRRITSEMNMDKIESVIVTQSIAGRVLDYGSIHILGTGEGMEHLHKIAAPLALRNCIVAR
jgi:uncharacterized membrane protein YdbT with pleckstrin-like domain